MAKQNQNTILLVEDDELYQEAIRDFLSDKYDVVVASSAEEAQKVLSKQLPDVMLMDINLPGIDGVEMLRRTKADHADLPIIMMTAVDRIPTVVECIKIGAFDYLAKPCLLYTSDAADE